MSSKAKRSTRKKESPNGLNAYDKLLLALSDRGLARFQSEDDGNCLYYSLESWLRMHGAPMGHMAIRIATADYMLGRAQNDYDNGLVDTDEFPTYDTYVAGIQGMKKPNAWFSNLGDRAVEAAAMMLGRNIRVMNWNYSTGRFDFEYTAEVPGAVETINILRTGNNHYDLLMSYAEISANPGMMAEWEALKAERAAEATAKSRAAAEMIKRLVNKAKKEGHNITEKAIQNMVNAGSTVKGIAAMLHLSLSSSESNSGSATSKKAAAAKKAAATKKAAAAATRKAPSIFNKLNKNNIRQLKEAGIAKKNIPEINIGVLSELLGRNLLNSDPAAVSPPASPPTSNNNVSVKPKSKHNLRPRKPGK